MDTRAFKIRKENKKAEAKKALLWMFLMIFAVLIVTLIVYMTYNRYMPSLLEWFKEEEDIVVEAVETEYKIEQTVVDEFIKLEKTISGALSKGEAVEIMLDIKRIEENLKDDKNKQYNLAFEGQKIKLIDQGIEGSISDQTVMEFAITTDEGIWVKADFSNIDKNDQNYKGTVYLKNYEKHEDYNCYNRVPITISYNKDSLNTIKFEPTEPDESIKTRIYHLSECVSNAPLEQIKTAIDNFIDYDGPARLFIDIIKYKEEFGIPILMSYQDQKIEITNSLRKSNSENPIYSSELYLEYETMISDDNNHEMIIEFNKNSEGIIKLIIYKYGEEDFFNYQNCFVETSVDTTLDGNRQDYEYGFIQFRNKVEGYYSIDFLEKCLLKEQVLKDIRDIKKQVIDITDFMTYFKIYRKPDTQEIYFEKNDGAGSKINTLIKTDSLQILDKDCTNLNNIVDNMPVEQGNILIKEFKDTGGVDFVIADSKLCYKIFKEDYVPLRDLLLTDEELVLTKLVSKQDETDKKWYLHDGEELIKQLTISIKEESNINSDLISPNIVHIVRSKTRYDSTKVKTTEPAVRGHFTTDSTKHETLFMRLSHSTPEFVFDNYYLLRDNNYIIFKFKHHEKIALILINLKYQDLVAPATWMTLNNKEIYEVLKNVQDILDNIPEAGAT